MGRRQPAHRQELSVDYRAWRLAADGDEQDQQCRVRYIPNVTMGWDSTTRVRQDQELKVSSGPMLPVVVDDTPEEFGGACEHAVRFLSRRRGPPILTVNAWNERTEGSYLEPDRRHGVAIW